MTLRTPERLRRWWRAWVAPREALQPPEPKMPAAPLAEAPSAALLNAAELPPGTPLGGYRVERLIGRGSSGAVYRALDGQGAAFALKVLALRTPQRFLRETESARRLRHPDIVALIDSGESHGLAWLAMELAPGHDLQRHTQAGALLPLAAVAEIGARVAAALAHAHRQGVVHRDVKPANVLVELAAGSVRLTDFGVARIVEDSAHVTGSGLLLGTVAFMSPEQLAGARVDASGDLYSLGVTLFQLSTGRLPHEADSMSRQMYAIANLPAPDVRSLRPEIGAPLAAIVARLLAKAPAERGADGDALAAELLAAGGSARATAGPNSGALTVGPAELPVDPMHNSSH